jgi:membrane protease YdiL (CAAX protease family)
MPAQTTILPKTAPVPDRPILYLGAYATLYASLLIAMHRHLGFELAEPLLVLAIMGVWFSSLAWFVTRKAVPLSFAVMQPARESQMLLLYLLPLTAYLAWGRNLLGRWAIPEPRLSVVILLIKLLMFVAVPAVILLLIWKYRWQELFVFRSAARHWPAALWMSVAMIGFQSVFGRGPTDIRESGFSPRVLVTAAPLIYLFLLLEVGLVEEFFFRVLLQSRLAAWLKSETAGIVGMSILFGLAHAPGLYYRAVATHEALGGRPSWLMAIGYSIVITSTAGFFLGVLWMRTRNLLLLMVVHAAGDLLPNLVPMLKNWA